MIKLNEFNPNKIYYDEKLNRNFLLLDNFEFPHSIFYHEMTFNINEIFLPEMIDINDI